MRKRKQDWKGRGNGSLARPGGMAMSSKNQQGEFRKRAPLFLCGLASKVPELSLWGRFQSGFATKLTSSQRVKPAW